MQLNTKDYLKDLISLRNQKEFSREFYFRWYKHYIEQEIRTKFPFNLLEKIVAPKNFQLNKIKKSNIPLDVVLMLIEKDLEVAPFVIDSVRKHVKQPIKEIYVVAPASERILSFCELKNLKLIDENTVLGYSKETLKNRGLGDRSGWYFQQLLKLGADSFVGSDYFLVMDADTILCKDRILVDNQERIHLDFSDEFHEPYYRTYETLMKQKHRTPISFVSHLMAFSKKHLQEMKNQIEEIHNVKWDDAVINAISYEHPSSFSEYETYANYELSNYPNQIVLGYWFNKSFKRKDLDFLHKKRQIENNLKSLSFHSHEITKE